MFAFAIDGEGNADAAEQKLGLRTARGEDAGRSRGKPAGDLAIDWPDRAVRQGHFIETGRLGQLTALPFSRRSRAASFKNWFLHEPRRKCEG